MELRVGRWRDAYERLSREQKLRLEQRAYEAVARTSERIAGTAPPSDDLGVSLDPASQLLRRHEVYVRKARRYQMRQSRIRPWTFRDLSSTLAWKAANEVLDHLRKIRRDLVSPARATMPIRHSDEEHQSWISDIIRYLETLKSKPAHDAAALLQHLCKHASALTETPTRGVSFKAKVLACELTTSTQEKWDVNRVQRARAFLIYAMSQFEGDSVPAIMTLVRAKIGLSVGAGHA
jgi:hypothetical protein